MKFLRSCEYVLIFVFFCVAHASAQMPQGTVEATIENINADQTNIQAYSDDKMLTFTVSSPEVKANLKNFGKGDRVFLTYKEEAGHQTIESVEVKKYSLASTDRIIALLLTALSLFILFELLLRKKVRELIKGLDNRYSNSQFQVVLWFFVLIVTYEERNRYAVALS